MLGTAFVTLLALTGAASSDPKPEVALQIEECGVVPEDEILRLTALNLDAHVVSAASATVNATRVTVICSDQRVALKVIDPLTGKSLERTLSLTTSEIGVAGRAVALAVAELVLASWMELEMRDTPPSAAPLPVAQPEMRRAAGERARARSEYGPHLDHLLLIGQTLGPFERLGVGLSGGIGLGYTLSSWLLTELELLETRSHANVNLGRVDASLWSAALRADARYSGRIFWLEAGPGLRLGVARLAGSAKTSDTRGAVVAGSWGGPLAFAGVGARFHQLTLRAGGEAGYVLREVVGSIDGENAVAVRHAWLGASVGLGWSF
ncbi:MAG TPA: hypothetical protein VGM29_15750 [Polyangiaceae bacterium]